MVRIRHCVTAEIELSADPVTELSLVIAEIVNIHPTRKKEILERLKNEINDALIHIEKEAKQDNGKPLR